MNINFKVISLVQLESNPSLQTEADALITTRPSELFKIVHELKPVLV